MGQTGEFAAGPLIVRQAASMQALYTNVSYVMLERCFNHELFSKRRAMQEEPVQFMVSDTATAFTPKYSVLSEYDGDVRLDALSTLVYISINWHPHSQAKSIRPE